MRYALLLVILLALASPSIAAAGTATLLTEPTPTLAYTAAPGERNAIAVRVEAVIGSTSVVLGDSGAPVIAGSGCATIDPNTVRCSVGLGLPAIAIDAGDGDDTLAATEANINMTAFGGEGADRLTGAGTLSGGPGNDVLTGVDFSPCSKGDYCGETLIGGPGDDVLHGGGGNDALIGDAGNDLLDGGPGGDTASYAATTSAVQVDLAAGTADGAGGERDRLTGVENVIGGAGDDRLLGDDAPNLLVGGAGDDRVDGRGGNDRLGPDTGRDGGADVLRGGAGDDTLYSGGRGFTLSGGAGDDHLSGVFGSVLTARVVRCGSGRDLIRGETRGQLISDCETIDFADTNPGVTTVSVRSRARADGRLSFAATCQAGASARSCDIAMTLRVGPSAPSRRSVSIHNPGTATLSVRPHRTPHRGDIVRVSLTGGLNYRARGKSTWRPSWRVRL